MERVQKETKIELHHGDCLKIMKNIPQASIDMILADPPYGITACPWDSVIPLEPLWTQIKRITKPQSAIVMTASQPFTHSLIASNLKDFRYTMVWDKGRTSGALNANKKPLKAHEDIVVFYQKQPTYNPQMTKAIPGRTRKPSQKDIYIGKGINEIIGTVHKISQDYDPTTRYPTTIIRIPKIGYFAHPTQKPVELMIYLVKTYSNENDTVLDFCMGSGTTGEACAKLNRKFIGIELNEKYFNYANKRIKDIQSQTDFGFKIPQ